MNTTASSLAIHRWSDLDEEQQAQLLERAPQNRDPRIRQQIEAILEAVRNEGDAAVLRFARQFDGLRGTEFRATSEELEPAANGLDAETRKALQTAFDNLVRFHRPALPAGYEIETSPGVICRADWKPIETVGLYAPGGSTPLPSTVLMLGVPSMIAKVPRRVLCSPAGPDGAIDPGVAFAARLCGIEEVFLLGGAQAIAAMSFGTVTVPRCAKLFGPGSIWVTWAKQLVTQWTPVSIDMPAGPSEVLVIADDTADPSFVAADLLAQLEHGPDSQAILVTPSRSLAAAVNESLERLAATLSRRQQIAESLAHSRILLVEDLDEAVSLANFYAAEHVIVNTSAPETISERIVCAGSVFVGPWTPEVLGDYCSGTNHVLPTLGMARSLGGLSVADFMKRVTWQKATRAGLERLGPVARRLAEHEGLTAHSLAIAVREQSVAGECA